MRILDLLFGVDVFLSTRDSLRCCVTRSKLLLTGNILSVAASTGTESFRCLSNDFLTASFLFFRKFILHRSIELDFMFFEVLFEFTATSLKYPKNRQAKDFAKIKLSLTTSGSASLSVQIVVFLQMRVSVFVCAVTYFSFYYYFVSKKEEKTN